jgi:hypothetical protein
MACKKGKNEPDNESKSRKSDLKSHQFLPVNSRKNAREEGREKIGEFFKGLLSRT